MVAQPAYDSITTLQDAALAYAEQGYAVIPLHGIRNGRCTCRSGTACEHPGKHPRTQRGFKDATTDPALIAAWWDKHPDANIGIAIPASMVVLDVDPRNGGSLGALGRLPETPQATTGGGGWHVWFRMPVNGAAVSKTQGVDLREGGKSYVVAPPSLHASGREYEWVRELGAIALLPAHLLLPQRGNYWLRQALAKAKVGSRNMTGHWLASQCRSDGLSSDEVEAVMLSYQSQVPQTEESPYTAAEAKMTTDSVFRGYQRPRGQTTTVFREAKGSEAKTRQGINPQGYAEGESVSRPQSYALPGEEEGDWELASISDETYREYMRRMRDEVDCFPDDGLVQHRGSNAQRRRTAQRYLLRAAFAHLHPLSEPLADAEMSTMLAAVSKHIGDGREGYIVLERWWRALEGHKLGKNPDKPPRTPRAFMVAAVRRAVEPAPRIAPALSTNAEEDAPVHRHSRTETTDDDDFWTDPKDDAPDSPTPLDCAVCGKSRREGEGKRASDGLWECSSCAGTD